MLVKKAQNLHQLKSPFQTKITCVWRLLWTAPYRRSILELKPKSGEYASSKSTFSRNIFFFLHIFIYWKHHLGFNWCGTEIFSERAFFTNIHAARKALVYLKDWSSRINLITLFATILITRIQNYQEVKYPTLDPNQ